MFRDTRIIHIAILLLFLLGNYSCKKKKYEKIGLQKVEDFGKNPGNLRMYYFEPENQIPNAPMVVVLHGCTQNAKGAAKLTGWNDLADKYGFYVLYPEQKSVNNPDKCFNWFKSKDNEKNSGENQSIANMVDYMASHYDIDPNNVHITGLSAGAAMACIMCAVYPDKFQSGAIMSGGPYKSAEKILQSYPAMWGKVSKTAEEWGNLVREQNPNYSGNYPRIAIFQGHRDLVVNKKNADELVKQWTNVHGIDDHADSVITNFDGSEDITKYVYTDNSGNTKVVNYGIDKMGHAVAVDPGDGAKQGGKKGLFGKDKDFYSVYWAALFFGVL